jgi:hypothetical protein
MKPDFYTYACVLLLLTAFAIVTTSSVLATRTRSINTLHVKRHLYNNVLDAAALVNTSMQHEHRRGVVVLLTCTAQPQGNIRHLAQTKSSDRIAAYDTSLTQWLTQTDFPVVIVDNSGYAYPNVKELVNPDVHEILAYEEKDAPHAAGLQSCEHKGIHELYAVQYAIKNSAIIRRASFVIKVTGRFFVPGLGRVCRERGVGDDAAIMALRQKNKGLCQIVGCRWDAVPHVFASRVFDDYVETDYRDRMNVFPSKNILTLPKLRIPRTREGGSGKYLTSL